MLRFYATKSLQDLQKEGSKMKKITVAIVFLIMLTPSAYARNPIVKYFAHLLDETKAERAIGNLLKEGFINELKGKISISSSDSLTSEVQKFVMASQRPEVRCSVYVIKSDIPDAIPLPDGTIFITSGLLKAAKNDSQKDFILASTMMHVILRHPMKLLKKEGLYAKFLNFLKIPEEKRKPEVLKSLIRDYLRNLPTINQKKADIQGILLTKSPEATRLEAIKLLKGFSASIWPSMPWDRGDIDERIKNLENTKFPR